MTPDPARPEPPPAVDPALPQPEPPTVADARAASEPPEPEPPQPELPVLEDARPASEPPQPEPAQPEPPTRPSTPEQARLLRWELLVVFAITLGLSGLRSLLSLLESLLAPGPLSEQSVALNAPAARADLIDLAFQLSYVLQLAAWGGLGAYLIIRGGLRLREIGLRPRPDARDTGYGLALATVIGLPGLGLYLVARAFGANLTVLPTVLNDTWWRVPVLVLAAAANAWAEELLMVGYLLTRLRQLGVGRNAALLISATLRGAYHLYQGFGGFAGNLVMGLIFGWVWRRTNRLWPLVIAHAVIDVVAFLGYAALHGRVSWLP